MSKYKASNMFVSLKFAIRGLFLAIRSQRNFRADLIMGIIACILAIILDFTPNEMAILVLTIGFVMFAELVNTVIEFVVDAYFGHKYSILAKMSKDISAGAVLLSAFISLTIGFLLFWPKINHLILR